MQGSTRVDVGFCSNISHHSNTNNNGNNNYFKKIISSIALILCIYAHADLFFSLTIEGNYFFGTAEKMKCDARRMTVFLCK